MPKPTGSDPEEPFKAFATEEEFQAFMDAELAAARKSGESRGRKSAKSLSATERAELEELREAKEASEEQRLQDQQEWNKLKDRQQAKHAKDLETKETEIATLRRELTHDRCHLELVRAATPLAFNPEQVAVLLGDRLRLGDDGKAVVLDPKTGEPTEMTAAQLVEGFLQDEANANLVKAATPGGGSRATGSQGGDRDGALQQLKAREREIIEKARESKQPQDYLGPLREVRTQIREKEQATG